MENQQESKRNNIRQAFLKMSVEDILEDVFLAEEWIVKRRSQFFLDVKGVCESPEGECIQVQNEVSCETLCTVYVPEKKIVTSVLTGYKDLKPKWIDINPMERIKFIQAFINEIEKNHELIAQIEVCSRGILKRDTKEALKVFTDYLQYYLSFNYSFQPSSNSWKPKGTSVGIFSNTSSLIMLGFYLGPVLSAGYNVILNVEAELTPLATLLVELARKAGMPENVVTVIPDLINAEVFFNHENVAVVSVFDDLHKRKYHFTNPFNKPIVSFASYKIPALVFENADLDSFCDLIVNATWGHNGTNIAAVGEIFVQEKVFKKVIRKLQDKLQCIKIGQANNQIVDIAYPSHSEYTRYNNLLERLATTDVELEMINSDCVYNGFTASVVIGNRLCSTMVLEEVENAPVSDIIPFRTTNEGISLANNTRQGFAASIWTENINLAYEVAGKLEVSNVWINNFNSISPDVAVSPQKASSLNYFGGKEGFYEYILKDIKKASSQPTKSTSKLDSRTSKNSSDENAISDAISAAKKALPGWKALKRFERSKKLHQVIGFIQSTKDGLIKQGMPEKLQNSWIKSLFDGTSIENPQNYSASCENNCISSFRVPRGILAIELADDVETHNTKLITGALLEGNAVVLVSRSKNTLSFYKEVSKVFPSGVLSVVPISSSNLNALGSHMELSLYIGDTSNSAFSSLPLKFGRKFRSVSSDWSDVFKSVTYVKNVWTNVKDSFV